MSNKLYKEDYMESNTKEFLRLSSHHINTVTKGNDTVDMIFSSVSGGDLKFSINKRKLTVLKGRNPIILVVFPFISKFIKDEEHKLYVNLLVADRLIDLCLTTSILSRIDELNKLIEVSFDCMDMYIKTEVSRDDRCVSFDDILCECVQLFIPAVNDIVEILRVKFNIQEDVLNILHFSVICLMFKFLENNMGKPPHFVKRLMIRTVTSAVVNAISYKSGYVSNECEYIVSKVAPKNYVPNKYVYQVRMNMVYRLFSNNILFKILDNYDTAALSTLASVFYDSRLPAEVFSPITVKVIENGATVVIDRRLMDLAQINPHKCGLILSSKEKQLVVSGDSFDGIVEEIDSPYIEFRLIESLSTIEIYSGDTVKQFELEPYSQIMIMLKGVTNNNSKPQLHVRVVTVKNDPDSLN